MAIARITSHAAEAIALLLEQYQDKPRLKALALSYLRRCQELDDTAWDVVIKRIIENAEGAQLDALGRLVGQQRESRVDNVYRIYILARIRINWSRGKPDDIIEVLRIVEATDFSVRWSGADTFEIFFPDPPVTAALILFDLANQARAAGVRIDFVLGLSSARAFRFGDADDLTFNATVGLGDEADPATGGLLEDVISN